MKVSRLGRAMAVGAALSTLLLGSQPVLAAEEVKDVGRTGYSEIQDPGGVCRYNTGNSKLWFINVYYPSSVHSDYPPPGKDWVGWRAKILRSTNSGASWQGVWLGPVQKAKANDQVPAQGFSNERWNAPATPSGWYKAHIIVFFYDPPSSSRIEGRTVWEPDSYWLRKGNIQSESLVDYCFSTH